MLDGGGLDETFAPAATAFCTTTLHWARLCAMLDVEHICPTALGRCQFVHVYHGLVTSLTYCENHVDCLYR